MKCPIVPVRAAALVAAILAVLACGSPGSGGAPPPQPPDDRLFAGPEDIAAERAAKDETFRDGPDSPLTETERPGFAGLQYFPYDPALRFPVYFRALPEPEPLTIITTQGKERPAVRAGHFEFVHEGRTHRLTAFQLRDAGEAGYRELFVPFMDATTGQETYIAGRYLSFDVESAVDGWYGLDFNLAYHPLCAYGRTDYVCPRTPEENRLPFAVRAGERGRAHQTMPKDALSEAPATLEPAADAGEDAP